jgi:hypothetical protein
MNRPGESMNEIKCPTNVLYVHCQRCGSKIRTEEYRSDGGSKVERWPCACPRVTVDEVRPTLAGLADALNRLLAYGEEPDSEVSCGVYEDKCDCGCGKVHRGSLLFDGVIDIETKEATQKRYVILGSDCEDEVRAAVAAEDARSDAEVLSQRDHEQATDRDR